MLKIQWAEFSTTYTWRATTTAIVCRLPFAYDTIDSTGKIDIFIYLISLPPSPPQGCSHTIMKNHSMELLPVFQCRALLWGTHSPNPSSHWHFPPFSIPSHSPKYWQLDGLLAGCIFPPRTARTCVVSGQGGRNQMQQLCLR